MVNYLKAELLSPSTLAFFGDSVYSLLVREQLCIENRPAGVLHKLSVKFVSAPAQAEAYRVIDPLLDENEQSMFRRGRNAHVSSTPKNSSVGDYHTATGLEALFGYLYLSNQIDRAKFLFSQIWEHFSGNLNL